MMANRLFVLAFSNDPVPISLATQDRRWFCVWSTAARMDANIAKKIWEWYRAGGFAAIAKWLMDRDVSAFNPSAAPMMTEFKLNLVEQGMSTAESYLVEMMRERLGEFNKGVVGAPFGAFAGVRSLSNYDGSADVKSEGAGTSAANNTFAGTITVTVVEILSNGNLVVAGEKQVAISNEEEIIRFGGIVNPNTLVFNRVNSQEVADARIEYRGRGVTDDTQSVGWFNRLLFKFSPF
jgi:hypothetical protein